MPRIHEWKRRYNICDSNSQPVACNISLWIYGIARYSLELRVCFVEWEASVVFVIRWIDLREFFTHRNKLLVWGMGINEMKFLLFPLERVPLISSPAGFTRFLLFAFGSSRENWSSLLQAIVGGVLVGKENTKEFGIFFQNPHNIIGIKPDTHRSLRRFPLENFIIFLLFFLSIHPSIQPTKHFQPREFNLLTNKPRHIQMRWNILELFFSASDFFPHGKFPFKSFLLFLNLHTREEKFSHLKIKETKLKSLYHDTFLFLLT